MEPSFVALCCTARALRRGDHTGDRAFLAWCSAFLAGILLGPSRASGLTDLGIGEGAEGTRGSARWPKPGIGLGSSMPDVPEPVSDEVRSYAVSG